MEQRYHCCRDVHGYVFVQPAVQQLEARPYTRVPVDPQPQASGSLSPLYMRTVARASVTSRNVFVNVLAAGGRSTALTQAAQAVVAAATAQDL